MASQSNKLPSELLRIEAHVQAKWGYNGWWTCMQVDQAVMQFGSKVEALLSQFDEQGKPKHSLKELLKPPSPAPSKTVSRLSRSDARIGQKPQRVER